MFRENPRVLQYLPCSVNVVLCNLNANSSNRIRIQPVCLHHILVLDVCWDSTSFESEAEHVRFFGLAECGDGEHLKGDGGSEILFLG